MKEIFAKSQQYEETLYTTWYALKQETENLRAEVPHILLAETGSPLEKVKELFSDGPETTSWNPTRLRPLILKKTSAATPHDQTL